MTTQNLAIALELQGDRMAGQEGIDLLAEAVTYYRDTLTVFSRKDRPMQWAGGTQNLAGALMIQGTRTRGEAGVALLREARATFRNALTVFQQADHPVNWAMIQESLAIAEVGLTEHPATVDPAPHLKAALEHVEAALTVFEPEHMSNNHARATGLLDHIQARLDAL